MKRKTIAFCGLALVCIAAVAATFMANRLLTAQRRLNKVAVGVCLSERRVLSHRELVERFRRSLVRQFVNRDKHMNIETWSGSYRVAIIYGEHDIDFNDHVRSSIKNEMSFEYNFNAVSIYDGDQLQDYRDFDPSRPLTVVDIIKDGYGYRGAWTGFYDLRNPNLYKGKSSRYKKLIDRSEVLEGFGHYFFLVHSTDVPNDCCDSRWPGEPGNKYEAAKHEAIQKGLDALESGKSNQIDIFPISNCGDVLVEPSPMSGDPTVVRYYYHQ